MADDELIGITQAARKLGLSHSTLSRQIKAGLIRSHGGKVKLSEVLEDRARNIDASIWQLRKKATVRPVSRRCMHRQNRCMHGLWWPLR